ncbi:MAG TPA: biotin carboxylase N-terminal domain-containing protein [Stellaceae bacterium]|nr:biotin carboxylase N-terminal domain-containing protein [Stellaceae bacterium]
MFASLLIANRGEIACRVIRTARRLGLRTVAVHSTEDAGALHVAMADEAYEIGPAPARESYLDVARILEAARHAKAEAIHPGYGFLSENAEFAAACEAAGIVFIGPPAAAMRALGDKAHAKALMEEAGVPVVPGYHGDDQSDASFAKAARAIGFPVLIKASAGGGGRGMRVVEDPGGLNEALASARREAESSFGDGRLLLEIYLARPRHIEVQVFADRVGNTVHLFERDCSIQRRHQKVIEEAPALALAKARRHELGEAAVTASRAAGYVGAGTVEFIAEGDAVYFIEMNTRLQVEHPVTEMITGLDLVEWQIRVAAGEALPLAQDRIASRGHAIEARLYAEDPARDFLPQAGTLTRLRFPAGGAHLRVETGLREGDAVGVHYDALLAKLVAWGEDRAAAILLLRSALAGTRVAGIVTNRDFLARVLAHDEFVAGEFDTGFIARHRAALLPLPHASFAALAVASLVALEDQATAAQAAWRGCDPHSPWRRCDGWRIAGTAPQSLRFHDGGGERSVVVSPAPGGHRITIDERSALARHAGHGAGEYAIELDGECIAATVERRRDEITVILAGETCRLVLRDPLAPPDDAAAAAARLTAPMPGKVLAVQVAPGAAVVRGQLLMVLEAMKMEHAITAPADGVVARVHYAAGDFVAEGALLLDFAAATRS